MNIQETPKQLTNEEYIQSIIPTLEKALDKNTSFDKFIQAVKLTLFNNPELFIPKERLTQAEQRKTLTNALIQCAIAGLLPNGKESVLFNTKSGIQFRHMIYGIEKKIFQMPVTQDFYTRIVYANEECNPIENKGVLEINHKLKFVDRGVPVAVYCVHKQKDGNISTEYMTIEECEHIRKNFANKNDKLKVWEIMPEQMYKKTLVHRYFNHKHFQDELSETIRSAITANIEDDFTLPTADEPQPEVTTKTGSDALLTKLKGNKDVK